MPAKRKTTPLTGGLVKQEYRIVPLSELKLAKRNPQQGDVGAVHTSIQANGFYGTIVARAGTGEILAGNHRYLAAKEDGIAEVPVVFVDVDDSTARRILLADNRTTDLASKDEAALTELLQLIVEESGPDGLLGTGYDGDDLDSLLGDFEPDDGEQPQLGEARSVTCPACGHEFDPNAKHGEE